MDDSVGKQLKQFMVRIKRFAIEQWLDKCEKLIIELINNYNGLCSASQPADF